MKCSVSNCSNDPRITSKGSGITYHPWFTTDNTRKVMVVRTNISYRQCNLRIMAHVLKAIDNNKSEKAVYDLRFPKDPKTRSTWLEALGLSDWEPMDKSIVCSDHFQSHDIYIKKTGVRVIKCEAVPIAVHDPANDMDAPAVSNMCRICLCFNTKMYDIKEHLLDRMYEDMMHLPERDDSILPQKICCECAHRLSSLTKFKNKAVRTQQLFAQLGSAENSCITIGHVRKVTCTENQLKTKLISQFFEPNDFDKLIEDEVTIKTEESCEELEEKTNEDIPEISQSDLLFKCDELLEVKNEENPEIYFQEFDEHFAESDDDIILSEVASVRVKKKTKIKKKKIKVVKKVRVVRKKEAEDEGNPSTTMIKFKTSDVRRRKTQEAFVDESLFTITPVTYEEQIAEVESRQQTSSYISAPYKCTVCYRGFLNKDRYDSHLVRHDVAAGEYECFICKTRLKHARALRKHLTSQHTEKYNCKGCPFVTKNRGVAREHEKWHAGTKYQCPHCPSEFDKITTYMGHLRIKHATDFVCDLCGYTFISLKGIEVHKKKKHKLIDKNTPMEGPFCDVCSVKFISDEAYERHLKLSSRHSNENDPDRIRNDSQSMKSERNGRMIRRVERRPVIHPRLMNDRPSVGPITCEQCGMQLRDLRLYAQHFRRLHPDKNRTKYPAMKTPCMCEQCGKIFQSMALLKDHMWVHTGEKRFKCDKCEKSFTQKTNLVFHMRAHSNTRPSFECPLCGKHFAFFNNRRRHMFIHTGLKPFKCDTCGKCFTTAGEQRAHVDHVHLKKPWPKRSRHRGAYRDGEDWEIAGGRSVCPSEDLVQEETTRASRGH